MQLNQLIDHTLLKPDATQTDIDQLITEALTYQFYTVMVNPYWVSYTHKRLKGSSVKIGTVVGFPLGANTTTTKVAEAQDAIYNGADEIDMVYNLGEFKAAHYNKVRQEVQALVDIVHGAGKVIKVIIEIGLLTDNEIGIASRLVADTGADYVKTSTDFTTSGATLADVKIMKNAVDKRIKIKAAGGIRNREMAEVLIGAGADRLGTSSSLSVLGIVNDEPSK
ncbi:deoxyribose-phosphate aldolase [Periweissella ghanensis]|uniref:Deoxyribose-phosphate aldolase n=1 Tax=Periweissella ghanensis TaxID=467997 RepID=A0ABM8Z9R1_9LACO|nr:deoxyribose-phosphate aldolase [Periweissella ghanensis]MCM0600479.1 deoxyribose-phosphate aldolase [Periweissella ghanensis]CAH0418055.1 Deoxyribose-phosphate aldolase 1 [Periweissella ghanensis]